MGYIALPALKAGWATRPLPPHGHKSSIYLRAASGPGPARAPQDMAVADPDGVGDLQHIRTGAAGLHAQVLLGRNDFEILAGAIIHDGARG